ncbi:MAG: thioredoxin family protein [Calditrichaeota bacterium]|nr:MAG: thioredoxin family protein [Calditrichota bacterium]
MKDIKVLGPGCAKCQELFNTTQEAIKDIGLECTIEKITDIMEIMNYGVMMTPALVVDGEVKVTGKVPSIDELKQLIV